MLCYQHRKPRLFSRHGLWRSLTTCSILLAFGLNVVSPISLGYAQSLPFTLPTPGTMVGLSKPFVPVILRGIKIHPDNPFQFDFIVDTGTTGLDVGNGLKPFPTEECQKIIKYFLASLTVPEDDLWVNLSPYEKERIIPDAFGQTEMGRDLLAQDYILKQLTASLMYPEDELGKEFWNRVYKKAQEQYGTTEIPINTFNKVWIVPDKAEVYETEDTVPTSSQEESGLRPPTQSRSVGAFITESHLKVMLESDYLALQNNFNKEEIGTD